MYLYIYIYIYIYIYTHIYLSIEDYLFCSNFGDVVYFMLLIWTVNITCFLVMFTLSV